MTVEPRMFLSATITFRRSASIRTIALTFLWSIFLVAVSAVALINKHGFLSGSVLVPGIVLLVLALNWSWCYARDHKYCLVIDDRGVTWGAQSWPWARLKAVRVFHGTTGYHVMIWAARDRGIGIPVLLDDPLTLDAAQRLVAELRLFALDRGVRCEFGEYSHPRRGK